MVFAGSSPLHAITGHVATAKPAAVLGCSADRERLFPFSPDCDLAHGIRGPATEKGSAVVKFGIPTLTVIKAGGLVPLLAGGKVSAELEGVARYQPTGELLGFLGRDTEDGPGPWLLQKSRAPLSEVLNESLGGSTLSFEKGVEQFVPDLILHDVKR